MKRRDFLKKGALAAAGAGLLGSGTTLAKGLELTDDHKSVNFNVNGKARMHLTFEPYELKLKHVFTVSSFSRAPPSSSHNRRAGYLMAAILPKASSTSFLTCGL